MKIRAVRSLVFFAVIVMFAGVAAFSQAPTGASPPTDYAHMTMKVEKFSDNIYTVTGLNGPGRTGGTIGVLTGPDGIFMVDATYAPLSDKVIAAIKTFSDEPIRFLVNTHVHGDHIGGNPIFAKMGATILGRPELRAVLAAQKNFDQTGLPRITYTSPTTFHMDGEEVVVTPVPPAHTDGDTMIYFRHADVLMIGDFFRAGYPSIGGTIDGMIQALGMAIETCGPNTKVVPGHGPVSTKADVIWHRDMLVAVRDRVADLIKQGKSEEEVLAAHPTAKYDSIVLKNIYSYYDDGAMVRYKNSDGFVKTLYEQLRPKS